MLCGNYQDFVRIVAGAGNGIGQATALVYELSRGMIAEGYEADLLLVDTPVGSVANSALEALAIGDLPGIGAVIIDGEMKAGVSRNTPPPRRKVNS